MNSDNSDRDIVKHYIEKSLRTFEDAKLLANIQSWDSCVNRLYYSCFYIVLALLILKLTKRPKTHAGTKNLFNEHFVKTGILNKQTAAFYSELMEKRGESDYDDFQILTAEDVLPLISQAEEFIITIQKLIL
jgi:uncharacterized protein (UPF0332 family)